MSNFLPLYKQAAAARQGPPLSGHVGLWYDKFCDCWTITDGVIAIGDTKLDWIKQASEHPCGSPDTLAESGRRRASLAERLGGRCMNFMLASRFITGIGRSHPVENGLAWHPTLGVPFLAGSAVKGLLRAFAQTSQSDQRVTELFGPASEQTLSVGSVICLDALPLEPVTLVPEILTPHTGLWNLHEPDASEISLADGPADWHSPVPVPMLAVEAGIAFQFVLLPRHPISKQQIWQDADDLERWLTAALRDQGAGAKTSNGFGRFQPPSDTIDVSLPPRKNIDAELPARKKTDSRNANYGL